MTDIIYKACKRTIMGGNAPIDMQMRLDVFYAAAKLSTLQYDELVELLTETV